MGGVLGVEGVVLAAAAPVGAVGPVDLEDLDAGLLQVAQESGAVGAGAFDTDAADVAEGAHPGEQGAVAGAGGGERFGVQDVVVGVDHGGDVQVFVGVHAADDDAGSGWDAGHVGLLADESAVGRRAFTEAADKTVMGPWPGSP